MIDDFSFHEILDQDGSDLEKGCGNLIGTSYYNYAMPFIRYNIKDLVDVENREEQCSCGRPFPVVKELYGKQCDYIETPDGRILGAVMSHSIDNAKGVICSQCIQVSLNEIEINLITDSSFDMNSQQELEKGLRKRLGPDITLKYNKVDQLKKKQSGKTPFIISEIGNQYI